MSAACPACSAPMVGTRPIARRASAGSEVARERLNRSTAQAPRQRYGFCQSALAGEHWQMTIACTSATKARTALTMTSARFAYFFANGGTLSCRPSRSELTSTCPSQSGPGADADGRHLERRGDLRGKLGRDRLEHDGERAGVLQRERIFDDELGLARIASALPVAALLVDRLRQHAQDVPSRECRRRRAAARPRRPTRPPSTFTAAAPASFSRAPCVAHGF